MSSRKNSLSGGRLGLFNVLSSCCILVETRLCAGTPVDRDILIHLFRLQEYELVKGHHMEQTEVCHNTEINNELEQHTESYRTNLGGQNHWVSLHSTKHPSSPTFSYSQMASRQKRKQRLLAVTHDNYFNFLSL